MVRPLHRMSREQEKDMAELNTKYYTQEDQYSDGDIEETMLEMAKEGLSYEDLPREEVSFPLIYHFAAIRENILNWYPFRENASVLEIGSGCGAITGLLCRKCRKVVSVELSLRRASINYERHKDCDNLTLMVGNLNDMDFGETFDYIILNGVLEYAASFTQGDKPYVSFLRKMASFLKQEGRILIAIENRLGLKYFAGAPEDHTDQYFLGLNDYPGCTSVRTFSRGELASLLEDSGLPQMRFYYPYPDYKFPREIFTDETLQSNGYGRDYQSYTGKNFALFEESSLAHSLVQEGVGAELANSFLVEASAQAFPREGRILYAKMNSEREERFQIATLICQEESGEKKVVKEALGPEAVPFVDSMRTAGRRPLPGAYAYLEGQGAQGRMEYPFVQGETLLSLLQRMAKGRDREGILQTLREFRDSFFGGAQRTSAYQGPDFQAIFGTKQGKAEYDCIRPANVDIVCDNIFPGRDKTYIIDYEWIFDLFVPVPFIMWRMLHDFYMRTPELTTWMSYADLMEGLGIDAEDQRTFLAWTKAFVYDYAGCDGLNPYAKPPIRLDLTEIRKKYFQQTELVSKLYYDTGKGLNEEESIEARSHLSRGRFCISFDLSQISDIRYLRLDIAQMPCWCIIDRVDSGCQIGLLPQEPYQQKGRKTVFFADHPAYVMDTFTPEQVGKLTIWGRLKRLDRGTMLTTLRKLSEEVKERDAMLENRSRIEASVREVTEEPAEVPSLGGLLRKTARRILGRDQKPQEEPLFVAAPAGSVDIFRYENGMVHAAGWAYDLTYPMENAQIAYYQGRQRVASHGYVTIYRSDVAEALSRSEAEAGGFAMTAKVQAAADLQVVLEYDIPLGKAALVLGQIPGDASQEETQVRPAMDESQIGDIRHFLEQQVVDKPEYPAELFGYTIDIIIPVYNGYDFLPPLFAGLEKTHMPYRLLVVNDKSPDPRILPWLEAYAASHSQVVLLNNEENLGFLQSVNRALELAEHHVVLLNTDVEVPDQWLERLMLPIIFQDKVATTTPFTTCGTICSFPDFCRDNAMFEGMSLWQVDNVFRTIRPQYPVLPTGVGFCMGMNLQAIREVGLLDAQHFGKGYGEENDWCQRAIQAGYKNLQVDNLFVYHKHGGSFLSEEKKRLLEEHAQALREKHPNYERDVAEYCQSDPLKTVRLYVCSQLLNQRPDLKTTVAFDHSLGGGATEYLEKKRQSLLRKGQKFILIRYNIYENKYKVSYAYKKYQIEFFTEQLERVLPVLGRVDQIWINELVTYQGIFKVLQTIRSWREEEGAYMKMLMHDYFALCPAVNLMDQEGKYCGVGEVSRCQTCIPDNRSNACLDYESAQAWRSHWGSFLRECDEVTVFSRDTERLLRKAYPELQNVTLVPHRPHYLPPLPRAAKTTETLNIGVLGVLSYKKGLPVIQKLVRVIEDKNLPIRIRLIGEVDGEIDSPVFDQTGRYRREDIPRLTLEKDIDIFFIPSIWPETFSYTTSEILSMDRPLVVFDVGAPAERAGMYDKGLVLPLDSPADTILEEIQSFVPRVWGIDQLPIHKEKVLFLAEEISFASRYRVEHFRETLALQGYASDYYQLADYQPRDLSAYRAVVVYRCSDPNRVAALCREARKAGIPVFYDVDDYVFDYDQIAYLSFLQDEEYKDFRRKTENIYRSMQACDGFLTSTDTLKKKIQEHFPGKKVVIKRNVASMEMQALSVDAWRDAQHSPDKVWIGYFSGSGTHNKDFAIIEKALSRMMEEYPQVSLKLGGVLAESALDQYHDRIRRYGFMEWQKLPAVIADVDINLMPLEDTEFHWCKSENKWMEAALVHVPSIISRNPELDQVVESGKTAFLCQTEEEWYQALKQLVEDPLLRRTMGNRANLRVLERYTTAYPDQEAVDLVLGRG